MISAPSIVAMKFSQAPYRGVGLIYYTKRVLLGLSEVAFIEGPVPVSSRQGWPL